MLSSLTTLLATFSSFFRSRAALELENLAHDALRPFGLHASSSFGPVGFAGPVHVLRYLGRYIHRVAISNHRLVSFPDEEATFRWCDSARNNEQNY